MKKWLSFNEFITPSIINLIFIFGTIGFTIAGVLALLGAFVVPAHPNEFLRFPLGFILLIGGNLFLRMFCESWLLFFKIYEQLKKNDLRSKDYPSM